VGTHLLVLAVLLAAATAAADVVVTDKEVIKCHVISCDTISLRLEMPSGGTRTFYTRDIREIHLSDSGRVAELADRLPQVRITQDSVRRAGPLDAEFQNATPEEMVAKCRELYGVLLASGQNTDTIAVLLRDVEREEQALRRIWPSAAALCLPGILGGIPLGILGAAIGFRAFQNAGHEDCGPCLGCAEGGVLGGAVGSALGAILGADARRRTIVAHRERVNTLVRRVNRAIATAP
jgi:hypothetical protein